MMMMMMMMMLPLRNYLTPYSAKFSVISVHHFVQSDPILCRKSLASDCFRDDSIPGAHYK